MGRMGRTRFESLWREETSALNKLNPYMTTTLGIEPGPPWWEASALTTAPSLLCNFKINHYSSKVLWFQNGTRRPFRNFLHDCYFREA